VWQGYPLSLLGLSKCDTVRHLRLKHRLKHLLSTISTTITTASVRKPSCRCRPSSSTSKIRQLNSGRHHQNSPARPYTLTLFPSASQDLSTTTPFTTLSTPLFRIKWPIPLFSISGDMNIGAPSTSPIGFRSQTLTVSFSLQIHSPTTSGLGWFGMKEIWRTSKSTT
jgi:hypothetical protein